MDKEDQDQVLKQRDLDLNLQKEALTFRINNELKEINKNMDILINVNLKELKERDNFIKRFIETLDLQPIDDRLTTTTTTTTTSSLLE
ncbi:hypothetical protein CYY_005594 [Polysphondylium violaceum]|uniref:Uncharacterized protein n=1 Tax=Polysphondylium violaceum TaxID=133409 RepID=A0A8J4PTZ9_9MYCE|nr:hypothetical protein CYY_005594 [Polysphondylium violaceum]